MVNKDRNLIVRINYNGKIIAEIVKPLLLEGFKNLDEK